MFSQYSKDVPQNMAEDLYREGYNSTETVVRVFSMLGVIKGVELNTLFITARGFGEGHGAGLGNCGALSGAVIVLSSLIHNYDEIRSRIILKEITSSFTRIFNERFSGCACITLKNSRRGCRQIVMDTVSLLSDFIKTNALA